MNPITDPIAASSAGNLISQQSVSSKQLKSNKNANASDSTSGLIDDTLETSDREADGRQPYISSRQPETDKRTEDNSPVSGDNLDLRG